MESTHDWTIAVDLEHLRSIRAHDRGTTTMHLLHEVLAHVADEAEATGTTHAPCRVLQHDDGSLSVRDHGRGTHTRRGERVARKPVMATRDLRFFDDPDAPLLPDGDRRRGMSVVAALSTWLVHENRTAEGAWHQRYEAGVPVTDLEPLVPDGTTGTLVRFLPTAPTPVDLASLQQAWPTLSLTTR